MNKKSLYLITGIITSLNLIGCGGSTPPSTPVTSANINDANFVEPTIIIEETIGPTPTRTQGYAKVYTTKEPVYITGGIDFTDYYTTDKAWYSIVNETASDEVLLVVKTLSDLSVIKDGDSFEMDSREEKLIGYRFFVYAPKNAVSISVPDKWKDIIDISSTDPDYGNIKYYFTIKKDVKINSQSIQILINYEDGTQDTITFNLNKPYSYTCRIGE